MILGITALNSTCRGQLGSYLRRPTSISEKDVPGEVALSKLTDNALAMRRACPTVIYVQTPFHHITFEELSACTTAVHAENYSTHVIKLVRDMCNLVGNL